MESERRHFDAIAPHYYDVVDAVWYDSGYYHRQELEVVTRCFKASSAPLEVLDAGCGPGRHPVPSRTSGTGWPPSTSRPRCSARRVP